jgi:GNAT superfamily N-acetyltransferase
MSRIRYLGVRAIPRLVAYRLFSQLFHYRAIRCVWVDLRNWRQDSNPKNTFEVRSLSAEEIRSQPKLMGEDRRDVDQYLGAGLQAFGAVKDSSIISFMWISPHPPSLDAQFTLEFDDEPAYFYNAFTLPEFRGLGLMPAVLRAALASCLSRGRRGAISFIDVLNYPSLAAFRSAGFKTVSTFRSAKLFGKHWIQPTSGQKMPRFRVQRVISEKQSPRPLCD